MTQNKEKKTDLEVNSAIAVVCKTYGLSPKKFCEMLQAISCITPEQKQEAIIFCTAFAVFSVKDAISNESMKLGV